MTSTASKRWGYGLWLGAVVLLPASGYFAALSNPFVYDDIPAVEANDAVRHADLTGHLLRRGAQTFHHFRPLPMLSFRANYKAGGLDPFGYRLTNLVLHIICAVLVCLLLRRLLGAYALQRAQPLERRQVDGAAMLGSLLFAVHPTNSLAVLLVWKRTTLMAALCYLGALLLFMHLRGIGGGQVRGGARRLLLAALICLAFALALGSKETAITLPAALLLLELWPERAAAPRFGARVKGPALLHLALWAEAAFALVVLFPTKVAASAFETWPYLLTQAKVIWFYLVTAFVPTKLAVVYDIRLASGLDEPGVLIGGLAIVALCGGAFALRRRWPLPALLVVWFFITLAPTSSFVAGPLLVDEDRTYLPFIALWAAAALLFVKARSLGRTARWGAGVAAALLLFGAWAATVSRAVTWNQEAWVWHDALQKYPGSSVAAEGLCTSLSKRPKRWRQAISSCQAAIKVAPESTLAHATLATLLIKRGKVQAAERVLQQGFRINASSSSLCTTAEHLQWMLDRPRRAIPYYRCARRGQPLNAALAIYLARCYFDIGDKAAARQLMHEIRGRAVLEASTAAVKAGLLLDLGQRRQACALVAKRIPSPPSKDWITLRRRCAAR